MIHFTKRSGRYTPVVGIDYLRGRAADTGEMAGSDDAVFDKDARTATVTVYRLTRGTRYAYSATARYTEYVPDPGPNGRGDTLWRKMPHVMLGKCAEALALRKAFPQQLAGLYVKEELEQARPDFQEQATSIADQYAVPPLSTLPPEAGSDDDPRHESEDARDQPEVHMFKSERLARLEPGVVLITAFDVRTDEKPTRDALHALRRRWTDLAHGPDATDDDQRALCEHRGGSLARGTAGDGDGQENAVRV